MSGFVGEDVHVARDASSNDLQLIYEDDKIYNITSFETHKQQLMDQNGDFVVSAFYSNNDNNYNNDEFLRDSESENDEIIEPPYNKKWKVNEETIETEAGPAKKMKFTIFKPLLRQDEISISMKYKEYGGVVKILGMYYQYPQHEPGIID